MHPYISIVIPTLNEEKNIVHLFPAIKKTINNYAYEIIVVDGHSSDKTVEVSKRYGAKILYDDIGKGSALIKGLKEAKGDIIISMDADLSHEPKELKLLIAGIETGYDICMGSRFILGGGSDDMPALRKFGNKIFMSIVNIIFGSHYSDMCYGYRSFKKGIFEKLNLQETGFGIETEINIKAKKKELRIIEIPSMEKKRHSGEGKLRTFRDGYIILRTIFKNIQ
jgi:glycosyltransferase involved in cell wall biosynthesis